jgi:hypothetical protein
MDHDDNEPNVPDRRSVPGARPLDRQQPHFGTYTPPAPYRVFRLIPGGGVSKEATRWVHSDGFVCLTIRPRSSPQLRLVDEPNPIPPAATPRF